MRETIIVKSANLRFETEKGNKKLIKLYGACRLRATSCKKFPDCVVPWLAHTNLMG